MVDRPIKKSDREAAQQSQPAESGAQEAGAQEGASSQGTPSTEARRVPPPVKKADRKDGGPASSDSRDSRDSRDDRGRGGKGRGKGRGRDKDDAPKGPMNPALMRGPKPTKKVEEPEEVAEAETDEPTPAGEATTDAAPEATETTPDAEAAPETAAAAE